MLIADAFLVPSRLPFSRRNLSTSISYSVLVIVSAILPLCGVVVLIVWGMDMKIVTYVCDMITQ